MKITDINQLTKISDFENFFNVYEDINGNYIYNLNSTLYINAASYETYTCDTTCYWPLISYKLYNTTRLAWLLMKINDVKATDIFLPKNPGDKIRYLPIETVNGILESL